MRTFHIFCRKEPFRNKYSISIRRREALQITEIRRRNVVPEAQQMGNHTRSPALCDRCRKRRYDLCRSLRLGTV